MRPLSGKHLRNRLTLGIMSGTSLDGVDLSLVRFDESYRVVECHNSFSKFPSRLRESLLALASGDTIAKSSLLKADRDIGAFYLKSAIAHLGRLKKKPDDIDLIGCHGQTVYHHSKGSRNKRATMQIGSPDILSQRLCVPVVSDFRTADIAAGGRGAPLTPITHYHLLNVPGTSQLIVNIGGISNATYLPGTRSLDDVMATDCGPGNMLIDQVCETLFQRKYDKDGKIASSGQVNDELLRLLTKMSFNRWKLPIALGREQFGDDVVRGILDKADDIGLDGKSIVATVSFFTAYCIARVARKFGLSERVVLCGGGSRNRFIRDSIGKLMPDAEITDSMIAQLDPDFVESISFALLANLTIDGHPGNLPQVTGADRSVILGKITVA